MEDDLASAENAEQVYSFDLATKSQGNGVEGNHIMLNMDSSSKEGVGGAFDSE